MRSRMIHSLKTAREVARRLVAAFASGCLVLVMVIPASAQQRYERRTLMDFFFGRQAPPERQPRYDEYPSQPRRQPRPPKRAAPPVAKATTARPDTPQPTAKLDTAKTVLVVGDFLATGLGDGLQDAFSASPGVAIQTRGNIASGLVRTDYYDWQAQLPKMLDALKPAVVVVTIGANDRQQMIAPGLNEKFGSDIWSLAYEERVQAFAKLVSARHIPLLWVGLPPFGSDDMTADVVKLNQIYQSQVESTGGEFVDLWGGFTDDDGKFIVTGSDINGQQVRLRTADGVNMTDAGRRKMAFYAEKPIRRLLGDQASPDIVRLDTDTTIDPAVMPEKETAAPETRTPPISLSDPELDGGSVLLGNAAPSNSGPPSPRDLLVEKGEIAPAPTGRVDDYRLPDGTKP
ncbi:DUF459 domain-containing protein [Rhizobium tumorigenes]|uniref:SGNH/GDSL hydrolase family protein n=1 Tax=Rhizobium tumorigenes TaxID=2041385 RepID=UPI00241C6613|nr:DUF459 domain-containing protein [Rhizobium tumorigenes]WFS00046.1 DUF459 domain-containing protein [Rhizobium tumorigenes]